jgi:hypothetical protein
VAPSAVAREVAALGWTALLVRQSSLVEAWSAADQLVMFSLEPVRYQMQPGQAQAMFDGNYHHYR